MMVGGGESEVEGGEEGMVRVRRGPMGVTTCEEGVKGCHVSQQTPDGGRDPSEPLSNAKGTSMED